MDTLYTDDRMSWFVLVVQWLLLSQCRWKTMGEETQAETHMTNHRHHSHYGPPTMAFAQPGVWKCSKHTRIRTRAVWKPHVERLSEEEKNMVVITERHYMYMFALLLLLFRLIACIHCILQEATLKLAYMSVCVSVCAD